MKFDGAFAHTNLIFVQYLRRASCSAFGTERQLAMSHAKHNLSLTEGGLGKNILIYSIPLMLTNLLQVLFNMADIAVVGRFSSAAALGEVGSTSIMVALFTGFLIGVSNGANVLVARFLGADRKKDVREAVLSSSVVCLFTGILILAVGLAVSKPLLVLMGTKPELLDGAVLYIKIYFLGMPALAMYNFGNAVYSAAGDTKKPLIILLCAGVLNVILNLFFVIVCKMSVSGVALASIISQYLSALLVVVFLMRSHGDYALKIARENFNFKYVKKTVILGYPSGLQNAIFQIANLFIQSGVNTFDAVMVEGNSAASNADNVVYDVMAAFYMACSSFMSQNYGAGKKERVIKSYLICLAYSFGIAAVLGALFAVFGDIFLLIFTPDKAVISAGMEKLRIMGFSYAVSAFMDCTIAASRGLGKTVVPTIIVVMGSCVFRIVWVYTVFAFFGTIASLYLLYVFSWSITAIAEIIYFRHCYKQQMALLG